MNAASKIKKMPPAKMGPWTGKSRMGNEKVIRIKKEQNKWCSRQREFTISIQKKNMMPTYWPMLFCPYTYFVILRTLSSNLPTSS